MKPTVGPADRHARVTIGLVVLALGWFAGSAWAWVGLIPIATGLTRRCPGYRPFNIAPSRTVRKAESVA